jgi:hypothetical protein
MGSWPGIRRRSAAGVRAQAPSVTRRLIDTAFRVLYRSRLLVFHFGTQLMVRVLPERWWYRALWRICRLLAWVLAPLIRRSPLRRDVRRRAITSWLLDSWLLRMTSVRPSCPIPVRAKGGEIVSEASRNPQGMLLCSAHLPLANACLQSLVEMNCCPSAVVVQSSVLTEGRYRVWGSGRRVPGIASDGLVLVRVRSVLRRGGSVAVLVDNHFCESYSSHVFELSRAVGAQVVFMIPELQPDGQILVEYSLPPDPFCRSEETIGLNLLALRARVDGVLQGQSENVPTANAPAAAMGTESACLSASALSASVDASTWKGGVLDR